MIKGKYTFRIFERGSDINTKDSDTLTIMAENETNALKECLSKASENYEDPEAVLLECDAAGGVCANDFQGQIPENMSKMVQIKKYVESESDKLLDGYTKNKVWPPKIKPKFDISSSRFREEVELEKFVESISSDVKEFLKQNPNAKPRDFIDAHPDRNLSYQGLVTAFYNARKELGITTTKGRGKAEIATPKKAEITTSKKTETPKEKTWG